MKISDTFGFGNFYRKVRETDTSFQLAYKLAKLAKKVEEEQQFYYNSLGSLVRQYGELDEQGNPIPTEDGKGYKIRQEVMDECNKKLEELLNLEIEMAPLLTTQDLDGLQISPELVNTILPFIQE